MTRKRETEKKERKKNIYKGKYFKEKRKGIRRNNETQTGVEKESQELGKQVRDNKREREIKIKKKRNRLKHRESKRKRQRERERKREREGGEIHEEKTKENGQSQFI